MSTMKLAGSRLLRRISRKNDRGNGGGNESSRWFKRQHDDFALQVGRRIIQQHRTKLKTKVWAWPHGQPKRSNSAGAGHAR
ncbi:MAG: hypothetical protein ACF788_01415 [Novipirellula sp. JB048]